MPEAEYEALVTDIRKNGQREAVILFEGMVLDGWHRYQGCQKAGVQCVTAKHDGSDPIAFVLSRNLHRRHLSASQRAAAVVAAQGWSPKGVNQHRASAPGADPQASAPGAEAPTVAELAAIAEVSPRTVEQVKTAQKAGLGDAVRDGIVSAKRAAEIAKLPKKDRAKALTAPPPKEQGPDEVAELRAKLAEAADEIERLSSVEQGEEADLIQRLQSELRTVKAKRDEAMRECVELKRQVKMLERDLKRAA
jgi:hypothetical protein